MKRQVLFAILSLPLTALLPTACTVEVPDEHYHHHYRSAQDDDFRDRVHHLREHYYRVKHDAERVGAGHSVFAQLSDIDQGISRVAGFVFSGSYEPDRANENIVRLHSQLRELSEQLH